MRIGDPISAKVIYRPDPISWEETNLLCEKCKIPLILCEYPPTTGFLALWWKSLGCEKCHESFSIDRNGYTSYGPTCTLFPAPENWTEETLQEWKEHTIYETKAWNILLSWTEGNLNEKLARIDEYVNQWREKQRIKLTNQPKSLWQKIIKGLGWFGVKEEINYEEWINQHK